MFCFVFTIFFFCTRVHFCVRDENEEKSEELIESNTKKAAKKKTRIVAVEQKVEFELELTLVETHVLNYCPHCRKSNFTQEMVCCKQCNQWLHCPCDNSPKNIEYYKKHPFICNKCKLSHSNALESEAIENIIENEAKNENVNDSKTNDLNQEMETFSDDNNNNFNIIINNNNIHNHSNRNNAVSAPRVYNLRPRHKKSTVSLSNANANVNKQAKSKQKKAKTKKKQKNEKIRKSGVKGNRKIACKDDKLSLNDFIFKKMELMDLLDELKEELLYYVEVKLQSLEDKVKLHPNSILFASVFSLIRILKICDKIGSNDYENNSKLTELDTFGTGEDELPSIVEKYNNNKHTKNINLEECLREYKEMKRIILKLYKKGDLKRMFETFRPQAAANGMPGWNMFDQIIKVFWDEKSPLAGKFQNICTAWEHAIICECTEPVAESEFSTASNIYDSRFVLFKICTINMSYLQLFLFLFEMHVNRDRLDVLRAEKQLKSKSVWNIAKQFGLKDESLVWMGNKLIQRMSPIVKSVYFRQKYKYSSPSDAVLGLKTFENEFDCVDWNVLQTEEM